jgi:cholera toxin transcriptional activator
MQEAGPARRYRFGIFEADPTTGELRRQGVRVKLNTQPFQLLCLLLDRPGQLLTREEICRELWPNDTFVDYEHGVNSAINRIREALGDTASSPRFVETLARRGYRFVAPVERVENGALSSGPQVPDEPLPAPPIPVDEANVSEPDSGIRIFATTPELPKLSRSVVVTLFVLLQLMYLGFYIGALANLAEIQDLLAVLNHGREIFGLIVVTSALLIPVRAFMICAVLLRAPRAGQKLLTIWQFLLPIDVVWAASPFLLLHHINAGLAIACTALLAWVPFVQRSLVLMGAGGAAADAPSALR